MNDGGIQKSRKEICVWGTGINAVNFTVLHRKQIKVIAYIDNYRTIDSLSIGDEVKVLSPDEAIGLLKKYFVVVAVSENAYWEIKKQLDSMGLVEFFDYCFHEIYEKKIAVLYGNCHMLPIKEGLNLSERFAKEYGFYPLHPIQNIRTFQNVDFKSKVFEHCHLFIHQSIQKNNRYGSEFASENFLKRINKMCKVIAVPNLYGLPKFLFPQISEDLPEKRIRDRAYFSFRDKYIEEMYLEGKNCEYIAKVIRKGEVADTAKVLAQYEQFVDKLQMRECDWDIKIVDWLIEKNCVAQLFYDVNHPTNVVMKYIIREILRMLEIDDTVNLNYIRRLDNYEVPVYGQIMRMFNMKWNNEYLFRKYSKYSLVNREIDLMQYIAQYINWYCCVLRDSNKT